MRCIGGRNKAYVTGWEVLSTRQMVYERPVENFDPIVSDDPTSGSAGR